MGTTNTTGDLLSPLLGPAQTASERTARAEAELSDTGLVHWADSDWSLSTLLLSLGYTHRESAGTIAGRARWGTRDILDESGTVVYVGGYDSTIVWLADTGHIAEHPAIARLRAWLNGEEPVS